MPNPTARKARIASVIAATSIALGCGTNYAYSAWGPDMASRMGFSATQANVIGAAGNLGQYAVGIPAGLLIDNKGPRAGVLVGAIALACGYFPIYKGYVSGPGSASVASLSFCAFLSGLGSCTAFSAAIKTATYNWPQSRGSATAYPLSAFGLSAFFFTGLGSLFFSDSVASLLLLLAVGTFSLNVVALPFMRLIPSTPIRPTGPVESRDASSSSLSSSKLYHRSPSIEPLQLLSNSNTDETLSLVSSDYSDHGEHESHHYQEQQEVTGLQLLKHLRFWHLWGMMFLLGGVGLMTINNIGNDAAALWHKYDSSATHRFVQQREHMHVGIISICSFLGRLASGIFSDFLTVRMQMSRLWCLVASASMFTVAQILALLVTNPNALIAVSSFTGFGYGALFGVFPALVADAFGVNGLSLNWGFVILAPAASGNVFNLWYGHILDTMTERAHDSNSHCTLGLDCYRPAYWLTLTSAVVGIGLALASVRSENKQRKSRGRSYARVAS